MQIHITLRFHLLSVRRAKIKTTNESLYWWEYKYVQVLWKSILKFNRKLGIDLPQEPVKPLLDIYQKISHPTTRILTRLYS